MTSVPSIRQYEPRRDASAKLLLLTTRAQLNSHQVSTLRQLATEIDDWDFFVYTAANKFSVTFAFQSLAEHASDIVPEEVLSKLEKSARRSTLATMRVAAAFLNFHKKCVQKSGAKYAYLKGIALSCQFNRPYLDRFSRDVDVLVASENMQTLIDTALLEGYQLLTDAQSKDIATNRGDIEFIARHAPVVLLKSPESVLIEVHRKMGKMSVSFDAEKALEEAVDVSFSGMPIKTLKKELHFVYVCYHHARHFWSHLHWLSDLDSMISHGEVERQSALRLASSFGLTPSIEAAFEFHELIGRPESWDDPELGSTRGGEYLLACLINLEGGLELEHRLREGKTLGEFISAWQISPGSYFSFWRTSWSTRVRPSVAQHLKYQLPRFLHWLYWAENILILLKNSVAHLPMQLSKLIRSSSQRDVSGNARVDGDDVRG